MGVATVAQSSLKATSQSFWSALPTIPSLRLLDFKLDSLNKSFVNFAVVVGVLALAKTTVSLTKSLLKPRPKAPSNKQLQDKYGHMAWAFIADCKDNDQYVEFLAKHGFSLILMGKEADVQSSRTKALQIDAQLQVECILVDWAKSEIDLQFYEGLTKKLAEHDIAFLVLPKLQKEKGVIPTHLELSQPFQHIYLLVRYFGGKLKFRSYRSAIVFPSYPDAESITPHNGVSQGLIAGCDAFGRIISFELRGDVEVVVARGSAENAFAGMGVQNITH